MAPLLLAQADATRIPLADDAVDLIFTSPPYTDARTYGIGAQRHCQEWVDWMLAVVTECARVSRGLVLINCAGVTRDRCYQPGPEGLLYEWWKRGGQCWRPAYWHRVGIPGSGGKQWLRADIEYVLAFKRTAEWLPWSDNVANGHTPKWGPGGEMSYRQSSGARVNQWGGVGSAKGMGAKRADGSFVPTGRPSHRESLGFGNTYVRARAGHGRIKIEAGEVERNGKSVALTFEEKIAVGAKLHTKRDAGEQANGEALREQAYLPPTKANPGNLLKINVGGGLLGHPLAHENEAPFPVALASWFIRSHCPPGGLVLDPFSGSGTTCDAAWREGRIGVGFDLRMSQCDLARRRLMNPYEKKSKAKKVNGEESLFAELAGERA